MGNEYFNSKSKFSSKTVVSLTTVCVLISLFIPITNLRASSPYLRITKSVDKNFASPDDEIVYTINYQNDGPGKATGIIIKDPFTNLNQHYLTFISASPTPSSGNDTWIIDSLDYGQAGQITIRARISESAVSWGVEIRNQATIDSNETSLIYSNFASVFLNKSPGLKIDKLVRNVSNNGLSFSQLVIAEPGDEVEFYLKIHSSSSGKLTNVKVWDELPAHLNYISGSTKVDDSSYTDGITNDGINIGSLAAGQTKIVKFKARVDSGSVFNAWTTFLTNYAYTEAENLPSSYSISDPATVMIERESTTSIETPSSSSSVSLSSSGLSISKSARNLTSGSTYTYWTSVIYAEPGDEIEFLIEIKAPTNKKIDSVRVEDKLPPKLSYISDSTTVDGYYEPDGITSKNVYINEVYPYFSRKIQFKAKIAPANQFNLYPISLANTAYAWGSDGMKISASAKIIVRAPISSSVKGVSISSTQPLSISKLGRNLSQSQISWLDSFSANPDEEVEFSIQISNTSDNDLTNVKVWDILPASLLIIENSTTIDGVSWGGDVAGAGLNLGTLNKYQTRTIKFKAKIDSTDNFSTGSTTLINTAYANADNVSQVSDQASVIVKKSGEVKGATFVATGVNLMGLVVLILISWFLAFIIYCRLREDKLLEVLNNGKRNKISKSLAKFYFKLKFFFIVKKVRFKKLYW